MKEIIKEEFGVTEQWKLITGTNERYSISNFGRVRNERTGLILKNLLCGISGNQYYYVVIYHHSKRKNYKIHRLVAKHFIPNPNNLLEVNHIDGNKLNNNVSNLEWCTHSYNNKHAYAIGLRKPNDKVKGENNGRCKLSESDVKAIKALYMMKMHTKAELARLYEVNIVTICGILNGRLWRHLQLVDN